MIPTFDPPHGPSPGYDRRKNPAINNNPFGDNYSQRSPKGLNNLLLKPVTLEWKLLSWDQAEAMEAFFDQLKGVEPFFYTLPPDTFPRKFLCSDYGSKPNKGDDADFGAVFEEIP